MSHVNIFTSSFLYTVCVLLLNQGKLHTHITEEIVQAVTVSRLITRQDVSESDSAQQVMD